MLKRIIYIVIALTLIVFTIYKLKNNKETAQQRIYHYDKKKPIFVQSLIIKSEIPENVVRFSGSFEPYRETRISADIQGKITALMVDLGSKVQQGQTLMQLDNSLLKLQLQSVEIQIEGLEKDVQRYTVLAEADAVQGIQLEKAMLGLKTAQVQKATLLEQIRKTYIRAPFTGIVTAKLTEVGAFAAPGIPLIQITDISNLKFTINVPENSLSKFELNNLCRISADAYPEIPITGKTVVVGSRANIGSSYLVQLSVKNTEDFKIKSGMFGKVTLENEIDISQISIPASALVGTTINPQVYLVRNGEAILQDISISDRMGNKVLVSAGLVEGDEIITNGFINLYNGAKVTLK
jgi:RND family efflux transporter MFP subunit